MIYEKKGIVKSVSSIASFSNRANYSQYINKSDYRTFAKNNMTKSAKNLRKAINGYAVKTK